MRAIITRLSLLIPALALLLIGLAGAPRPALAVGPGPAIQAAIAPPPVLAQARGDQNTTKINNIFTKGSGYLALIGGGIATLAIAAAGILMSVSHHSAPERLVKGMLGLFIVLAAGTIVAIVQLAAR